MSGDPETPKETAVPAPSNLGKCNPYLIQSLRDQKYHLPGNESACKDWWDYMRNNHPILGVCFASRYHPAKFSSRLLFLLGSVTFGLVITNIFYLTWIYYEEDFDIHFLNVTETTGSVNTGVSVVDNTYNSIEVTTGMLILWFGGSLVHGIVDHVLWKVATGAWCGTNDDVQEEYDEDGNPIDTAKEILEDKEEGASDDDEEHEKKSCWQRCQQKKSENCTTYLMMISVLVIVAAATLGVVLRSSVTSEQRAVVDGQPGIEGSDVINFQSVDTSELAEFLLGYSIELLMAYFFYFPLCTTILFSGVLSCRGRFPRLGGRPREVQIEQELQKAQDDENQ